ncbi:hypothetical protein BVRB_9g205170 [Beta vulgaris subsp. vulgaris]|nr:hypothetical protein BVRB_9g205170 [Beta vulgaris subsp. vulgaris]
MLGKVEIIQFGDYNLSLEGNHKLSWVGILPKKVLV